MKNTKFNKRHFATRLVVFPFVFALLFVSHNFFVIKRTWHFLLYGGEYVNFEENERDSMLGIFQMLKEIRDNQLKKDEII